MLQNQQVQALVPPSASARPSASAWVCRCPWGQTRGEPVTGVRLCHIMARYGLDLFARLQLCCGVLFWRLSSGQRLKGLLFGNHMESWLASGGDCWLKLLKQHQKEHRKHTRALLSYFEAFCTSNPVSMGFHNSSSGDLGCIFLAVARSHCPATRMSARSTSRSRRSRHEGLLVANSRASNPGRPWGLEHPSKGHAGHARICHVAGKMAGGPSIQGACQEL